MCLFNSPNKKDWSELTESERDMAEDEYIRKELRRLVRESVKSKNNQILRSLLAQERTYLGEYGEIRVRGVEPKGLVIDTKSKGLLDRIIWQMIKSSNIEVVERGEAE